ncbi:radical SAM protein [candidate division KSB1 bacterium]|nr:radical SAM protein [candidate division KSB1 bacterium]NIR71457.1 radical SAM protein [candidate division KSB1 bacterium]NIS23378.1 radical SAM protein [candidate division KSB1 bacterium]NIT70269.1 radical SAM protein [candidate division KSB1 bacterium]NIU23992.1 radical SAM protein [candidate division KSB1 bacterium]
MANILLTTVCNRACSYCFAKEKMTQKPHQEMSMENVEKVIAFLKRSNLPVFRMMGGEPTLHSRFPEIVMKVLEEGFRIDLLSNALWNKDHAILFENISPEYLNFLLNIDHPSTYSKQQWTRIGENLARLKDRKENSLSFNIFENPPRADYVFELATRYEINSIRLSFSMPIIGPIRNAYLELEEYPLLAQWVIDFAKKGESLNLKVGLDNTVPLCMFTKEQIGELVLLGTVDPQKNFQCCPVVDIGPDLSIWRCFGTSEIFNAHLDDFNTLEEAWEYFEEKFDKYQYKLFPLPECNGCKYANNGKCQGGCIGYTILRMRDEFSDTEDLNGDGLLARHLRLAPTTQVKHFQFPKPTIILSRKGRSRNVAVSPEIWSLLSNLNGNMTVADVIEISSNDSLSLSTDDPVDCFIMNQTKNAYYPWVKKLLKHGFLEEPATQDISANVLKKGRKP